MLRRVFGPKSEEEAGGHRRVHKKLRKVHLSHVGDICPVCSSFGKDESIHIEVVIDH